MKTSTTLHLSMILLACGAVAACSSAATDDDGTSASDISETTPVVLDDAVSRSLLAGGCRIDVDGKSVTTEGTGGACPTKLSEITEFMLNKASASVFVVSEQADQPSEASYRFVVGAGGDLASKLFVATVSGGTAVDEDGVEAIGFSPSLQAYVFYKAENGRWTRKGDGAMVKSHAENAKPAFECIRCHSTGTPLMKELHDAWGNWNSPWFGMPTPSSSSASFNKLFEAKSEANELESLIVGATHLAQQGRVARAKKEGQLSGILTQLMCEVGEPTLIGSHAASGNRLGTSLRASPMLPMGILTNQLLGVPNTGSGPELGLEQSLRLVSADRRFSTDFGSDAVIDAAAYVTALAKMGQTIGGHAGDTIFPMSSPEKSYADTDAIQELLRTNLVDADLVGDVLMTDFTVPAFSDARCKLASTIPATWTDANDLRARWSKSLATSKLRGASGLAKRLANTNDSGEHAAKLKGFQDACLSRSSADKAGFAEDMLKIVSQRRREFEQRYSNVIESDWLIPQDNLGSKANALRLDAKTCAPVATTTPFDGEE